jgi:hypothetical protein
MMHIPEMVAVETGKERSVVDKHDNVKVMQ